MSKNPTPEDRRAVSAAGKLAQEHAAQTPDAVRRATLNHVTTLPVKDGGEPVKLKRLSGLGLMLLEEIDSPFVRDAVLDPETGLPVETEVKFADIFQALYIMADEDSAEEALSIALEEFEKRARALARRVHATSLAEAVSIVQDNISRELSDGDEAPASDKTKKKVKGRAKKKVRRTTGG